MSSAQAATLALFDFSTDTNATTELGGTAVLNMHSNFSYNATEQRIEATLSDIGTGIATNTNIITYTVSGLSANQSVTITGASFDSVIPDAGAFVDIGFPDTGALSVQSWSSTYSESTSTISGLTNGDEIQIRFAMRDGVNGNSTTDYAYITNMEIQGEIVTSTIPEPSSLFLLGFGGLALVSRRKR